MRDFDKELFYGQFRGELFAHCKQMKVVNAAPMYAQALTNLLHWAVENLPDDETVLVPAQGGGTYSYWSNPESAVLAKISLT